MKIPFIVKWTTLQKILWMLYFWYEVKSIFKKETKFPVFLSGILVPSESVYQYKLSGKKLYPESMKCLILLWNFTSRNFSQGED